MLVDIDPLYDTPEKIQKLPEEARKLWESFSEEERSQLIPNRLGPGVWDCGLNPTLVVDDSNLHESLGNLRQKIDDKRSGLDVIRQDGLLSSYGVCDGVDNLLSHPDYADVLNGPRKFTVFITEVKQRPGGDWRWHKWGPYIGSHTPHCEYLADEEGIESVWIFRIDEHRS